LHFDDLGEWSAVAYHGLMDQSQPAQELTSLRDFLKRLESGELSLRRKGLDVTQEEVAVLKREIDHLEATLARARSRGQNT
jgi:polyhydroxyalkanoate synthesis regulator phasin